jgi:transcriptional regulator GlxA family with amidase domain
MEESGTEQKAGAGRHFAVLLFPGFPMMAFSSVVEPLRAANALGAVPAYRREERDPRREVGEGGAGHRERAGSLSVFPFEDELLEREI